MKIKATATVNAGSDEFDYPLFEVTDIHKLMHNLLEEHPTMSLGGVVLFNYRR